MSFRRSLTALGIGAALLLLGWACGDGSAGQGVVVPDIHPTTEIEYAEAIDAMRDAWRSRPRDISEDNGKAEQRFIARLGSLANHTQGTSNFKATKELWREVYTEHFKDYPEEK